MIEWTMLYKFQWKIITIGFGSTTLGSISVFLDDSSKLNLFNNSQVKKNGNVSF
jgi:hypothetical protein